MNVQVYGTDWCPYCVAAERLLEARDIPYERVTLDVSELRDRVLELSGRLTVPLIMIGGSPIGGYNELSALDRAGTLAQLVERAAAA